MADDMKMEQARLIYQTVCRALDDRQWHYEKDEPNFVAHFGVSGEDIPMKVIIAVDAERQVIRVMSPLPFRICEEKRMEGAIMTCVANFGFADGNFDYDLSDGSIVFRMTATYRGSVIGVEMIQYMISCTCAMVDNYNDQFMAVDKGMMSLADFMEKNG